MSGRRSWVGDSKVGCAIWVLIVIVLGMIAWKAVPVKIASSELYDYMDRAGEVRRRHPAGGAARSTSSRRPPAQPAGRGEAGDRRAPRRQHPHALHLHRAARVPRLHLQLDLQARGQPAHLHRLAPSGGVAAARSSAASAASAASGSAARVSGRPMTSKSAPAARAAAAEAMRRWSARCSRGGADPGRDQEERPRLRRAQRGDLRRRAHHSGAAGAGGQRRPARPRARRPGRRDPARPSRPRRGCVRSGHRQDGAGRRPRRSSPPRSIGRPPAACTVR